MGFILVQSLMDIISLTSHIPGQLLIVNTNKIVVIARKNSNTATFSAGLTVVFLCIHLPFSPSFFG
jgi:hypothetical protein